MTIKTRRLLLRPFTPADLDGLFAYASERDIFEKSGSAPCNTREAASELLWRWCADENHLALTLEGRVIGHINIKPDSEEHRADTRELGFALGREYHRQGYMSEAVRAVLARLFGDGIEYVWACCFQDNAPSRGLIESCSFSYFGDGTHLSKADNTIHKCYEYRMTKEEYFALQTKTDE